MGGFWTTRQSDNSFSAFVLHPFSPLDGGEGGKGTRM